MTTDLRVEPEGQTMRETDAIPTHTHTRVQQHNNTIRNAGRPVKAPYDDGIPWSLLL